MAVIIHQTEKFIPINKTRRRIHHLLRSQNWLCPSILSWYRMNFNHSNSLHALALYRIFSISDLHFGFSDWRATSVWFRIFGVNFIPDLTEPTVCHSLEIFDPRRVTRNSSVLFWYIQIKSWKWIEIWEYSIYCFFYFFRFYLSTVWNNEINQ